ncbi:MAG: META domain-containing protein [Tidjanibacter sp.]|nr:META domain-containing protein [Tidjanibacter sp.]
MKNSLLLILTVLALSGCCNCGHRYAAPFTATTWQLQQIDGHNVTVKLSAEEIPFLVFGSDGRFNGSGGCNRIGGDYSKGKEGRIAFSNVFSTKMYCPNDAVERQFLEVLNSADSYSIDGIYLYLFSNGTLKAVLQKQ